MGGVSGKEDLVGPEDFMATLNRCRAAPHRRIVIEEAEILEERFGEGNNCVADGGRWVIALGEAIHKKGNQASP